MTKFKINPKFFLYLALIQSLAATLGSLYFSEVVHLPPCSLCWYQRIFMYPIVLIIPTGIIKKDEKNLPCYVLPMTIIGGLFAFYHSLLQWKILPDQIAPCSLGVSCTTTLINLFGFVTIPFMSFLGFTVIGVCMLLSLRSKKYAK
jgi:disulfide bond formation protein DsbB